jgi:hypothetical protein
MIIYKTTNLITGKIYVGQDSKNNPNYLGSGKYIWNAIKKYGKENFKKEIICGCNSREELNEKEIYWIKELNSTNLEIGYNKGNYVITENNFEYNQIINYIMEIKELQQYTIISIEKIWRGTRAVTYDTLPFFTKLEEHVYWFTGGSFAGCRVAQVYSKWFADYIFNKPYRNLIDDFDPTIDRLHILRFKYYCVTCIIIFLVIRKLL